MGSHRHTHVDAGHAARAARRTRRGPRGLAALVVLGLAAGATVTGSASATPGAASGGFFGASDDDPQRVLQSVSVGVGPDGAITGIDSTSISKTESSELTSTEDTFDPADAAGDLPVRILTSYRLGDRSGTDLSEIAGESGRVVVEVVVQNTTVRPQELTYDVGSTQRSQYALVGAPLTVVATADLGPSGLTRVVTDDGTRASRDGVTNGVLSRSEDDAVRVQWASLLAPPRLSPSATFRLVQETDDFQVPTFDVNVQPGLVTDTSVQGLLEAAFSEEAGSTLSLESSTIGLVGRVTNALEDASDGLSDIERLLDTSATTIGQRTISDLQSSSASITGELQGLARELDGLNTDIDRQLEATESSTLKQLSSTVEAIKSRLGDPDRTAPPAPVKVTSCSLDVSANLFGDDATVFAQLLRVQSQLTAIGDATRTCAADLADDLRTAIGSTDGSGACTAASPSLICALGETRESINQQALDLSTVGTDVAGRFEADRLDDLRTGLRDFNETFADLQDTAGGLTGQDVPVSELVQALLQIAGGLTDLQAVLQPSAANGIPATLRSIHDQAEVALGALGSSSGSETAGAQARAAAAAACALSPAAPALPGDPASSPTPDGRDAVSVLLTGATCSGAPVDVPGPYGGRSVAERADAALAAVVEIERLADIDAADNPVSDALSGLNIRVGSLVSLVNGAISGSAAELQDAVEDLSDRLSALGVGTSSLPTGTTCPDDVTSEDDLTALNRAFGRLYCKQAGLESYLTEQFGEAGDVLDEVSDDLTDGQTDANEARVAASKAVDDTTTDLSKRLDKAGNALARKGAREIAEQRRRLDTEVGTVTRLLSQDISTAVRLIDSRVRTANGNLDESQRRLVSDLARVLTDIGNGRDGAGLLGALASGGNETRLANQSIVQVSDTASAFRNLRSAAMEDTLLQQAQLTRSLELQQELPVFGLTLPAGSRYVSVFSFHLSQG